MTRFPGWLLLLSLVLLAGVTTHASAQCPGITTALVPFAEEELTISTTPVFLTSAKYANATMATMSVSGGPVTFFYLTTPTPTSGHQIVIGPLYPICGNEAIKAFRAVRQTAIDALLTVSYFRAKAP